MTETILVIVGLILSHMAVAYGAVRLFLYGHLYGRHSALQDSQKDSPSLPSTDPKRISVPLTTSATMPPPSFSNPSDPLRGQFDEPSLGAPETQIPQM